MVDLAIAETILLLLLLLLARAAVTAFEIKTFTMLINPPSYVSS